MDQFSSQLANNLENGYTAGVPEHIIQIYKELSAWCELIQYKIDLDINTKDNIRKQVLSNNLLKHIQGLWQEKVNEFYSFRRDEARDNLSKAFQNRITNCQKVEEDNDIIGEEHSYENVYSYSNNEKYFNDNDSLPLEDNYYQNVNNIPSETILNDDDSKMVVVVKYNPKPQKTEVTERYINFEEEYEFDYGNDNYDYNDEYDDYNLYHYKEANTFNCKSMDNQYDGYYHDNNYDYRGYYERPASPSIPEDPNVCAADILDHNDNYWNSDNTNYYDGQENQNEKEDNLSYTEKIIKEQRKTSYVSFGSMDSIENRNTNMNKQESNTENITNQQPPSITIENNVEEMNSNTHKNEKHKLSITINESVINCYNTKKFINENHDEDVDDLFMQNVSYKEHLYPRTIRSRDMYEEYDASPTSGSVISPNEELLLSATDEDFIYEYSSEKVLMTPISFEVLTYSRGFYSSEEKTIYEQEELNCESKNTIEKVDPPPTENKITNEEESKEEDITKYLSNRRDSGFSETCDEPFILGI